MGLADAAVNTDTPLIMCITYRLVGSEGRIGVESK